MLDSRAESSASAASSSKWQEFYQAALLELDSRKMPQRISDARHAICDRAEELLAASTTDERSALNDALQALRVLEQSSAREKPAA
jgi:hypothetical protein